MSVTARRAAADLDRLFPGDSEMARRMRAYDWSQTPLGPPDAWPQNLRIALGICLTSRFPMHVWWGRSLTLFYNDAYISFLGRSKHPAVLGRSGREAWAELWDTIGPMIDRVFADGTASWSEDILMFFARDLPQEEVYVTFSFSPVFGEAHTVEGMYCACMETSEKIVGSRRLDTLRKLGVEATVARSVTDACRAAGEALAGNPYDVPFAAIYVLDEAAGVARLAATAGLPDDGRPLPAAVAVADVDETSVWPLGAVLRGKRPAEVTELTSRGVTIRAGAWPEPIQSAVVLPLRAAAHDNLAGLLVAGVSPRRRLNDGYRTFFDLVAGHIATALAGARAYEAERTRAEALAALDRAKNDFFSNVSHEFRTTLTLMLGPLVDELRGHPHPSPRLEVAHRSALRLLKLVNALLDFSRIEAGRNEASYQPTELASFTAELAGVFRAAIEQAGLRLAVDCPPLADPVYVDREMWEKIVLNLLSNAFKFTFEGEIAVVVRTHDGRVDLSVSDTGVGIPAADLPRVFERFHRIRHPRARTYEGTGIGLALVEELVKLHGGDLTVSSVEGVGTTFTASVPTGSAHLPPERMRAPSAIEPAAATASAFVEEALRWVPPSEPAAGGVTASAEAGDSRVASRVVFADDNADMRDYVGRLLAREHEVIAVADGEAALAAARDHRPDLVLSDVMMPRLDGCTLVDRLRADPRTRDIPIVLLSARAGEEARVEGLAHGADDYLIKPFSARELLARVRTLVELSRARRLAADTLRRGHAELEARAGELQALLRRLVHAQEDERKRVARDIHDQLGQPMTALRLNLDALETTRGGDADPRQRTARVQELCEELDRSIDFLIWSLRPAALEDLGLPAALSALVRGWSDRFRIGAEFEASDVDALRLPADVETHIYRITQEALHNIYKHAQASHVGVSFGRRGDRAALIVEDNGRGFDVDAQSARGEGLGLVSMRERAALAGGRLDIESAPGQGTTVFLHVPM